MKHFFSFLAALMLIFSVKAFASNPDDIVGKWMYLNEKGEQVNIEVYKEGDRYYGKIIWLQVPNYTAEFLEDEGHPEKNHPNVKLGGAKIDFKNPDAARQNDPIIGLVILKGVKYEAGDDEWNDGFVYKADEGKTYTCFVKLEEPDKLKLKGYILGMPWLGKTRYWTRMK
jgi:uncharacterized protein (DUF2147 family)